MRVLSTFSFRVSENVAKVEGSHERKGDFLFLEKENQLLKKTQMGVTSATSEAQEDDRTGSSPQRRHPQSDTVGLTVFISANRSVVVLDHVCLVQVVKILETLLHLVVRGNFTVDQNLLLENRDQTVVNSCLLLTVVTIVSRDLKWEYFWY